jgi:hypothetical protein
MQGEKAMIIPATTKPKSKLFSESLFFRFFIEDGNGSGQWGK